MSAPAVVLQDLLRDVRDRVVVAVTFLAMLELAKGRELTIEQDEPWGPIVCRGSVPRAGRMSDLDAVPSQDDRRDPRRPVMTSREPLSVAQLEALLFVAERPLSRREIAT